MTRRAKARRAKVLAGWLAIEALAGCNGDKKPPRLPDLEAPEAEVGPGIDAEALDPSTSPCDDFYQYACGGFVKRNPIPTGAAGVSRLAGGVQRGRKELLKILESAAAGEAADDDPYGPQVGKLFESCKAAGAGPEGLARLGKLLASVGEAATLDQVGQATSDAQAAGADVFFGFGALSSLDDAKKMAAWVVPGSVSLPAREFYEDSVYADLRAALVEHVETSMQLAGVPDDGAGDVVLAIEGELAKALPSDPVRDLAQQRHPFDRAGLEAKAPHVPWGAFLQRAGVTDGVPFNVARVEVLERLEAVFTSRPAGDLRRYVAFRVVEALGPHADAKLAAEAAKWDATLGGSGKLPSRVSTCVREAEGLTGLELSRPFAARVVPAGAREQVLGMLELLRGQFDARFAATPWLDEGSRAEARAKLKQMGFGVAAPATWPTTPAPPVDGAEYVGNRIALTGALRANDLSLLAKPRERGRWDTPTMAFNALYYPLNNEVRVLAGILVPPVYSSTSKPSVNWGTIGMVAGHELTHGFDDTGRKLDGDGTLRPTWSAAASAEFDARAACLEKQFSAYEVVSGVFVDGKLTLGENIADLGGLRLAHAAMLADPALAGADLAAASREFFTAYAQLWCENVTPAYATAAAKIDVHSPGKFRVNGPLTNLPAFAEAFGCATGTPMAPPTRCEVW